MTTTNQLQAEIREEKGKGAARTLRREGKIPAIIYGGSQGETKVALPFKELQTTYLKGGFTSRVIELETGKETIKVLPRDVQLHPVTDEPLHVDFLRVDDDTKVQVGIKINFINRERSPGLKRGGVLNIVRRRIDLICRAADIPSQLTADLSGKQIRDSIHISAVKLPDNVEPVIKDRDFTIATIAGRVAKTESTATETEEASGEAE